MPEPIEEWRPVVGWEGYDVSNLGRVRSWRRCGPDMSLSPTYKILASQVGTTGYPYVSLCLRTPRKRNIHLLVLEAFVGPCPEGMEACHGPGGPGDARLSNLRWDTRSANNLHDKHEQGTALLGFKNHQTRVSDEAVIEIRRRYAAGGVRHQDLADAFGLCRQHVTDIIGRRKRQYVQDTSDAA